MRCHLPGQCKYLQFLEIGSVCAQRVEWNRLSSWLPHCGRFHPGCSLSKILGYSVLFRQRQAAVQGSPGSKERGLILQGAFVFYLLFERVSHAHSRGRLFLLWSRFTLCPDPLAMPSLTLRRPQKIAAKITNCRLKVIESVEERDSGSDAEHRKTAESGQLFCMHRCIISKRTKKKHLSQLILRLD